METCITDVTIHNKLSTKSIHSIEFYTLFELIFVRTNFCTEPLCAKISTEILKFCGRCAKIDPHENFYFHGDEVRENLSARKLVLIR